MNARRAMVLLALAAAACNREASALPQLVIVVDTDMFTVEDTNAEPEISPVAVLDTVRVDLLDDADKVTVFREFSATVRDDWPLSFGVPSEPSRPIVRLRIRGFRARDAVPVVEHDGERDVPTLAPLPELAIDRVIEVTAPTGDGEVRRISVRLTGACLGRPASFGARTTCVGDGPVVPFAAPLAEATGGPSAAATWPLARPAPCVDAPIEGRVCIPGGLGLFGSRELAGLEDNLVTVSPLPLRAVHVSPFWADVTEMTVARAKKHLSQLTKPPFARGETTLNVGQYCTFDPASSSSDDLPLNCVDYTTATELCALEGGRLPTEAEWNHMASGRGQGRTFPWGEDTPNCCTASLGRKALDASSPLAQCVGEGLEKPASHRPTGAGCGVVGDVSRDGVMDLAGSVAEILADRSAPLDDACWGSRFGVLVDPTCPATRIGEAGARGSSWPNGIYSGLVALRRRAQVSVQFGVRCVYPDGGR